MRFWDTSAVLPLLVKQPASQLLDGLLKEDTSMVVWWVTEVECVSAIARMEGEQNLTLAEVQESLGILRALAQCWNEIDPAETVRDMAKRILRVHPLRAADALQLAAAWTASENRPASLAVVTLDQRLALAAEREGFSIKGYK